MSGPKPEVRLEYVELNDSDSFDVVGGGETKADYGTRPALLSGALWVGKTRLIDLNPTNPVTPIRVHTVPSNFSSAWANSWRR